MTSDRDDIINTVLECTSYFSRVGLVMCAYEEVLVMFGATAIYQCNYIVTVRVYMYFIEAINIVALIYSCC